MLQGFDNTNAPLFIYSCRLPHISKARLSVLKEITSGPYLPGIDWPVWRIPWVIDGLQQSGETFLYQRTDPMFQERNLCGSNVMVHRKMSNMMKDLMSEEGTPPEQFSRLGL
ncbi:MAG: hypothetical protein M1499_08470 [Firmicutes bacterium]|nr:hypothetical protein [Bacillota bacterium]